MIHNRFLILSKSFLEEVGARCTDPNVRGNGLIKIFKIITRFFWIEIPIIYANAI